MAVKEKNGKPAGDTGSMDVDLPATFTSTKKIMHPDSPGANLCIAENEKGEKGVYSFNEKRMIVPFTKDVGSISIPEILTNKKRMVWVVLLRDHARMIYSTVNQKTKLLTTVPPEWFVEAYLTHDALLLRDSATRANKGSPKRFMVRINKGGLSYDLPIKRPDLHEQFTINVRSKGGGFAISFWGYARCINTTGEAQLVSTHVLTVLTRPGKVDLENLVLCPELK